MVGPQVMMSEYTPNGSIFLSEPASEIEAVLFDMDGVLVDSVPLHIKAWNTALADHGLPLLDRAAYVTALGRTNMDMIGKFLGRHGLDLSLESRREVVQSKERFFRLSIKEEALPLPGVVEWLEFLSKKHIRCAVASSGEMANVVAVLDALKLSDYFAAVLSGARLPKSKPDPSLFLHAAASVGAEPIRCLVVEDAPAGIQAAKAARMLCCALSTTCLPDELGQADLVLANLGAVDPASIFVDAAPDFMR